MQQKTYKYRVYPTEEQRVFFAKCFGCCRKIWNLMLADRNQYYKDTGSSRQKNGARTPIRPIIRRGPLL